MDPEAKECGWMGCGRNQCAIMCQPNPPTEIDIGAIDIDVVSWIKHEMAMGMDHLFMLEVMGPAIFGDGNFVVFQDVTDQWCIRARDGWKPAEMRGLFDQDGVAITFHAEPMKLVPIKEESDEENP